MWDMKVAATTELPVQCNQPPTMLRLSPVVRSLAGPSSLRSSSARRVAVSTPTRNLFPPAAVRAEARRSYATEPQPSPKSQDKVKDKQAVGPFNIRAAALFVVTGAGLFWYFQHERQQVAQRRAAETASQKVGRPRIGGPFELVCASNDGKGYKVTHADLEGAFSLIYFGFTNCPDICPEELDKMGAVVDSVDATHGPIINPIFVSCDPARDTIPLVSTYISDFHPRMLGLTGPYEAVKAACKSYRVYFSTPPDADPSGDYLVDHSIFFYLMDPEGRFVDAFGRSTSKEEVEKKVRDYVERWTKEGLEIGKADLKERLVRDETRRV